MPDLLCIVNDCCHVFGCRKLRCPRNTLHVNLFVSFILRATMALFRDALMPNGLGLSKDLVRSESGHVVFDDSSSVRLRLFTHLRSVVYDVIITRIGLRRDHRNFKALFVNS